MTFFISLTNKRGNDQECVQILSEKVTQDKDGTIRFNNPAIPIHFQKGGVLCYQKQSSTNNDIRYGISHGRFSGYIPVEAIRGLQEKFPLESQDLSAFLEAAQAKCDEMNSPPSYGECNPSPYGECDPPSYDVACPSSHGDTVKDEIKRAIDDARSNALDFFKATREEKSAKHGNNFFVEDAESTPTGLCTTSEKF